MNGWDWFIWTGVCIAAASAAVGGALLLAVAWSGRRARAAIGAHDEPHGPCDCCGYELRGLEKGYCPECGWFYADNCRLPPNRRRRRAAAGIGLLLIAAAAAVSPRVVNNGALSLLPDWALITALPLAPGSEPTGGVPGGPSAAAKNAGSGSELHRVLRARLDRESLSPSARSWLADRCAYVIARSRDEPARLAAASLLKDVGEQGVSDEIPATVTAGLDDPSIRVRERVVAAIGRLAASASGERARRPLVRGLLCAAVCDRDARVRREAVAALGRMAPSPDHGREERPLLGVLARTAEDPCSDVRVRTLYTLSARLEAFQDSSAATTRGLDLCTHAAHDPHPGVREAAVFAMSRTGHSRFAVVALLSEALGDSSRDVREMAENELARLRAIGA